MKHNGAKNQIFSALSHLVMCTKRARFTHKRDDFYINISKNMPLKHLCFSDILLSQSIWHLIHCSVKKTYTQKIRLHGNFNFIWCTLKVIWNYCPRVQLFAEKYYQIWNIANPWLFKWGKETNKRKGIKILS